MPITSVNSAAWWRHRGLQRFNESHAAQSLRWGVNMAEPGAITSLFPPQLLAALISPVPSGHKLLQVRRTQTASVIQPDWGSGRSSSCLCCGTTNTTATSTANTAAMYYCNACITSRIPTYIIKTAILPALWGTLLKQEAKGSEVSSSASWQKAHRQVTSLKKRQRRIQE